MTPPKPLRRLPLLLLAGCAAAWAAETAAPAASEPASGIPAPMAAQAAAPDVQVRTEEPRAYGYVVGDVIERRAHIALPPGQHIAGDALPRRGRVDAWLELRHIALQPRPGGAELHLVYQLINAPPKLTTIELPPLDLVLRDPARPEARPAAVSIDAWPVTVAPLTPEHVLSRAGLADVQPDIQPLPEPTGWLWARMALWSSLLAGCLFAWAVQRHPQLAFWRRHAPFRLAWLDLRRLQRRGAAGPEVERRALERMHRAFDAAAGCAVFAQRLEPLYAAQPALRAAANDIDAFFAASRSSFFAAASSPTAGAATGTPDRAAVDAVLALCRRLARLEAQA
jgi:mxaA protein